tara:strand:- start:449 stop:676 length:228 start_codon:yes stop_codon:yes gene_type:complete
MRVNPRKKHKQPTINYICPKCKKSIAILAYSRKWGKCSCGREYPAHILAIPTHSTSKAKLSSEQLYQLMKDRREQ